MKRVVLVGLINDTNIGDIVIYNNTKYLVEKALKELEIEDVVIESMDMTGKSKENGQTFSQSVIRRIFNKIITPKLKAKIRYLLSKKSNLDEDRLKEFYEEKLKDSSLVIFVGGGIIKYLYQDFYKYISLIIDVCDKFGIDVILNSVGIEGYNEKDDRCQRLKKALNRDCVKLITTRDDFDLLKNNYIKNDKIIIDKVADPAIWTYETYKNNISQEARKNIGLGIIRPGIFKDNDINFNEKKQIELWKNIIKKLEEKGYNWQLFTNGLKGDYDFAQKILENMQIQDKEKLIDMPTNGEELINIISKFKGVIAARMHANIISYSLDIPSVGIVWNKKLKMFGENIKVPERFVTYENFNADYIVEKLERALEERYKFSKEEYKETVYQTLKGGLKCL